MKKKLLITVLYLLFFNVSFGAEKAERECIEGDCINGKGILKIYYKDIKSLRRDSVTENGNFFSNSTDVELEEILKNKEYCLKYEGQFKNKKYHGKGNYFSFCSSMTMNCLGLYSYKGEFKNGKPHGYGFLTEPLNYYEGNFENGSKKGRGTMKWEDGEHYSGEFKDNLYHGKGNLKFKSGDFYTGNFENGYLHGEGFYEWKDGETYRGNFKLGKKNGFGVSKFPNGDSYQGEFENDLKSGKGTYVKKNGTALKGKWKNDKLISEEKKQSISEEKKQSEEKYFTVNDLILDIDSMINKEIKVKGWLGFCEEDKMCITNYHSLESLFSNQTGIEVTMKKADRSSKKYILEKCQTSIGECQIKFKGKLISSWGNVKMSILKIIP